MVRAGIGSGNGCIDDETRRLQRPVEVVPFMNHEGVAGKGIKETEMMPGKSSDQRVVIQSGHVELLRAPIYAYAGQDKQEIGNEPARRSIPGVSFPARPGRRGLLLFQAFAHVFRMIPRQGQRENFFRTCA